MASRGLFLSGFSSSIVTLFPGTANANQLSVPKLTGMIQRTTWARGCSQTAALPTMPCFGGKGRVQA